MLNAGAKIPEFDTATWSSSLNEVMRLCLAKETWDRPTAKDLAEYCKFVMNGVKRTQPRLKHIDIRSIIYVAILITCLLYFLIIAFEPF